MKRALKKIAINPGIDITRATYFHNYTVRPKWIRKPSLFTYMGNPFSIGERETLNSLLLLRT